MPQSPDCVNVESNNDAPAISSTPTQLESPTCGTRCRICTLGISSIVEAHVTSGMQYHDIIEAIEKETGHTISTASISRHMTNFRSALRDLSLKKTMEIFDEKAEQVSEHQRRVLFMAKLAFDDIMQQYERGRYQFSVDDLEKLIKLFYQILRNPDQALTPPGGGPGTLVNIFQRFDASFGPRREATLFEKQGAASFPHAQDSNDAQMVGAFFRVPPSGGQGGEGGSRHGES